jgi:hypothetical protein
MTTPALAGGLTKTITLPDGRTRQVSVLVPESKASSYEGRGFSRSSPLASRANAVRYRDGICKLAANPPPQAKAPFAQLCNDANAAIAEMK